jgi:glycosyltransferase involved in cell wall biosynthesis
MKNKITVITAVFNSSKCLPELILSLENQTCDNFDWVVVDGGSDDGTVEILERCRLPQLRFLSEPDFGIYHAINKALLMTVSEYYLVIGADDTLRPDAVENFLLGARDGYADIYTCNVLVHDDEVKPKRWPVWLAGHKALVAEHAISSLFRTKLHSEIGYYSNQYPIAADHEFILKCYLSGKKFVHLSFVSGKMGKAGISSSDALGAVLQSFRVQTSFYSFFPQLLLLLVRIIRARYTNGHV